MNYQWVDQGKMIGGIVVSDLSTSTKAARRRRRTEAASAVKGFELDLAIAQLKEADADFEAAVETLRSHSIDERLSSTDSREEIVAELRPLIQEGLNQSHDFRSLLTQIRANVLAIFETRFPGLPPQEAGERLENEGAIYFATELMIGKIDATKFLTEPNLIHGKQQTISFHPFLLKFVRIYQAQSRQRDVNVSLNGACYGRVRCNPDALGSVVHAVLDNATKYAPVDSNIAVVFDEQSDEIRVRIASLGPKIEADEQMLVFQPGYRGRAARQMDLGGQGFGLTAAMSISDILGLSLSVQQSSLEDERFPSYYTTTFSFRIDRAS